MNSLYVVVMRTRTCWSIKIFPACHDEQMDLSVNTMNWLNTFLADDLFDFEAKANIIEGLHKGLLNKLLPTHLIQIYILKELWRLTSLSSTFTGIELWPFTDINNSCLQIFKKYQVSIRHLSSTFNMFYIRYIMLLVSCLVKLNCLFLVLKQVR